MLSTDVSYNHFNNAAGKEIRLNQKAGGTKPLLINNWHIYVFS